MQPDEHPSCFWNEWYDRQSSIKYTVTFTSPQTSICGRVGSLIDASVLDGEVFRDEISIA